MHKLVKKSVQLQQLFISTISLKFLMVTTILSVLHEFSRMWQHNISHEVSKTELINYITTG